MLSDLKSSENIIPIHRLERSEKYPEWSLHRLRGRLTQLCSNGSQGALTSLIPLIQDAQAQGEYVAWVRTTSTVPYPPDMVRAGIDVGAIAHVRVERMREAMRVASHLLRSDGFGLIVLDIPGEESVSTGIQGKIVKLAQLHDAVVICLTSVHHHGESLSALVSLRMQASLERLGPDQFQVLLHADKDKRHGPGWTWKRLVDGTPGLY